MPFLQRSTSRKKQDKQYLDIIASADKLLADKSYQPARVQYQSALKLKPEEKYPQDRIAEIDLALTDLAKQKVLDDSVYLCDYQSG